MSGVNGDTGKASPDAERFASDLTATYQVLDQLVSSHDLADATLVVDVPGVGRQILHTGRRPLRERAAALVHAPPGLYADPPGSADPVLVLALASLAAAALRPPARHAVRAQRGRNPIVTVVDLDQLELALRALPGVTAVGFVDDGDLLLVEIHAVGGGDQVARDATRLASRYVVGRLAVEVVRWGDGGASHGEHGPTLVAAGVDPAAGAITVELAWDTQRATGVAPSERGLLGAVDATLRAVRILLPDLAYQPGWARTIETTPDRRFLVVASVTDPPARDHRRGIAEAGSPIEAAVLAALDALDGVLPATR